MPQALFNPRRLAGPGARARRLLSATTGSLLVVQLTWTVGCGTLGGLPPGNLTRSDLQPSSAAISPSAVTSPAKYATSPPPAAAHGTLSDHVPDSSDAAAMVIPVAYTSPQVTATELTSRGTVASPGMTSHYRAPVVPASHSGQACGPACGANCGGSYASLGGPATPPYRNPEEYIFDGGDQPPGVVIQKDWSAAGINPSDTVIYYETLAGTVCVQPSNRVPIYAPRFGSVRQVSGLQLSSRSVGTERILVPVSPEGFAERDLAGTFMQPVAPHGEEQVGLIDAFQENRGGIPIAQTLPPMRMSEARVPFEFVELFGTGQITAEELAVIGRVLENARTWSTPESLQVEISGQSPALTRDTLLPQDVYVYELPDKCAMRICKAASHTIANPGDIVSFTIRFDNAGTKPLGNVVIMDSLAPRLAYIEGSQQCSADARFSLEPNDVGSMVLKWELESAVKPSEGGVISFDCRVR